MTTRVYIAARYERREEMLERARELEAIGGVSTATWLNGDHEALDNAPGFGGMAAVFAHEDVKDIAQSHWLALFTDPPGTPSRGGRHTEFGIAFALSCLLAVIGEPENVFHWHDEVQRFATWADFLSHLEAKL